MRLIRGRIYAQKNVKGKEEDEGEEEEGDEEEKETKVRSCRSPTLPLFCGKEEAG